MEEVVLTVCLLPAGVDRGLEKEVERDESILYTLLATNLSHNEEKCISDHVFDHTPKIILLDISSIWQQVGGC